MNIKKATPGTGAALIISDSDITNKVKILKAPYQRRCLKALILAPVGRSDLDKAIGTTNAPEFVKRLRRKGLTIHMEKIPFINRDGYSKWRGKYHLDTGSLSKAKAMLGGE